MDKKSALYGEVDNSHGIVVRGSQRRIILLKRQFLIDYDSLTCQRLKSSKRLMKISINFNKEEGI